MRENYISYTLTSKLFTFPFFNLLQLGKLQKSPQAKPNIDSKTVVSLHKFGNF